jgi:K+-transporting ATPase ATPase C chain
MVVRNTLARWSRPGAADATPRPGLHAFVAHARPLLVGLLALTVLTGLVFPAALYVLARATVPARAAGDLVTRDGVIVGSRLIGEAFVAPGYFHPRPSGAGNGYDGTASGASNLSPSNPAFVRAVKAAAMAYRRDNGLPETAMIPMDAITRSGSGLDPHISPWNAALQAPRVARARGLDVGRVRALVAANTLGRQFGFLGEPRVDVLDLNLALDRTRPRARG